MMYVSIYFLFGLRYESKRNQNKTKENTIWNGDADPYVLFIWIKLMQELGLEKVTEH